MKSGNVVLALDGGGTGTRAGVFDLEGSLLGQGSSGPSHPFVRPQRAAREALEEACVLARKAAAVRSRAVVVVYASIAGVGDRGQYAPGYKRQLSGLFTRADVVVEGDIRAALWAGLEHPPGVVIMAGTGSAAYAEGDAGRAWRVGGWGPDFGDEGSAFALARRGLQAAAKSVDGRGPSTILVERFLQMMDCETFRDLAQQVRARLSRKRDRFARLAQVVCQGAYDGDEVCCELMARTAHDLVEMARAAALRLQLPHAPVTWSGSLFRSGRVLLDPLREELALKAPMLTIRKPHYPPFFGSYLLAMKKLELSIAPNMRSRLQRSKLQVEVYSKTGE